MMVNWLQPCILNKPINISRFISFDIFGFNVKCPTHFMYVCLHVFYKRLRLFGVIFQRWTSIFIKIPLYSIQPMLFYIWNESCHTIMLLRRPSNEMFSIFSQEFRGRQKTYNSFLFYLPLLYRKLSVTREWKENPLHIKWWEIYETSEKKGEEEEKERLIFDDEKSFTILTISTANSFPICSIQVHTFCSIMIEHVTFCASFVSIV